MNINKFVYGKLAEKLFYELINSINPLLTVKDLDDDVLVGACYKYDCSVNGIPYSIKCIKKKSDVILINKNNANKDYDYKRDLFSTNYIVISITDGKIYLFQYNPNIKYNKHCNLKKKELVKKLKDSIVEPEKLTYLSKKNKPELVKMCEEYKIPTSTIHTNNIEDFIKDSGSNISLKSSFFGLLEEQGSIDKNPYVITLPRKAIFNKFIENEYKSICPIDLITLHYAKLMGSSRYKY